MRTLLHLLLGLVLLGGQLASSAHALAHARHELDRAAWLHASALQKGQPWHAEHAGGDDADRAFQCGPADWNSSLDHGKDRCAAFAAVDASIASALPASGVSSFSVATTIRFRSWGLLAAEQVPFSSRAPPLRQS